MYVFLGAVAGVLGFLPLYFSLKKSKKVTKTSNFGYGALMMLGVLFSLVILLTCVLICYFWAKDNLIAFALAAAITLSLFAIAYGIFTAIRRKRAADARLKKNKEENKE